MQGVVAAVAKSSEHRFSKQTQASITLIAGVGVEGDAHAGTKVKHRSRVAVDPTQPNLRQVHLIASELIDELRGQGFEVAPGVMGENVTTRGLDPINLPRGTLLRLGPEALIEVTGLRNPCIQLDNYQQGLTRAVLGKGPDGELIRKAGIMAIVLTGGTVAPGDVVVVELPALPHLKLERV